LIGTSVTRVAEGAQSATGASQKIADVNAAIDQVSSVIRNASEAAQRQSKEIDQLARTIQELDQLTQSNSDMVDAYTGAASGLRGESQRLAGLVTRFKLPERDARLAPMMNQPAPRQDEPWDDSRRQLPRSNANTGDS